MQKTLPRFDKFPLENTQTAKQEPPRVIPRLGLDKLVKFEPDEFPAQEDDAMSAESSESAEAAAKQEPPRVIPRLGLDKLPKFEPNGFPAHEAEAVPAESSESTEAAAKQEPPRVIPKLGLDKLPRFDADAQAGFPAQQKADAEESTENTQKEEAKQEPTSGAAAIAGEARQGSWQAEKATRRPPDAKFGLTLS